MRGLIFLLVFLWIGWMGGSTWCYVCNVKGLCEEGFMGIGALNHSAAEAESLSANYADLIVPPYPLKVHADGEVLAETEQNFIIIKDAAQVDVPVTMDDMLESLKAYMNEYSEMMLKIKGGYVSGEMNETEYETLGMARAEAVKTELVSRGFDAERIYTEAAELPSNTFERHILSSQNSIQIDFFAQLNEGVDADIEEDGEMEAEDMPEEKGYEETESDFEEEAGEDKE